MLTSDTKRRIDSCRDILVGKLPLPTDQVELITLALIYKFMDDLDEESVAMGGRRSFFTGPLAPYRWRELMSQTLSAEERMTRFADGLELLGGGKKLRIPKKGGRKGAQEEVDVAAHLPALFRDIFRNAFLKFRDGRILTLFLTELSGFAYSHSEELGNAFEYILSVMGAQGDNGQFRTPRHVIDFMVACLDPQPGQTVLDPACGTGGFLVSAFRHILLKHTSPSSTLRGDRLTHTQRQKLYAAFTGYDINDQMVKLSRVNLFLHDFATPQIHIYDTLTNDARWPERYDLILANPPFMTPKGGVVPHTKFRVPAKKSEVLFTDYIAEHLTPDGRAGIVVPNGIVATTQTAYVKLRRFLVEESLVAVVSLPAGCFKPYSGVKTSILLLDKKLARTTDRILFLKIAADGFDLGDKRTPIEANDLPEAERVIRAWLTGKLGDDFASPLAWKAVEKRELLGNRSVGLQAEPFLGEPAVAHEVEVARLADIAEINPKKSEVRSLAPETPVSFVPMEELHTDRPYFTAPRERPIGEVLTGYTYFRDGDVLLAKITPCFENGKAGIAKALRSGIGFGSSEFYVFRCGAKVLPEYLYYQITRPAFREEGEKNMSGTGGQQRVIREFLENYEIPLPPLEEQRRIVAEIEGYQQVIDGARQILAAYKPRLDPNPDWESVRLDEVCDVRDGTHDSPKYVRADGFPLVTSKNLRNGFVDFSEVDLISRRDLDAINKRSKVDDGDILMPMIGTIGNPVIAKVDREFAVKNVALIKFHKSDRVLNGFVKLVLGSPDYQEHIMKQTSGVAQKYISLGSLRALEIPLPPLPEQERIVAELEAEAAKVEAVRGLIPLYEGRISRTLARVWGTGV